MNTTTKSTKKMPKYTFITQREYDNMKLLQNAGLTIAQAHKVTNRSPITVSKLFKSSSLEEYKQLSSYKKPKEIVQEASQTTLDLTTNEEMVQLLLSINDKLTRIEKHFEQSTNAKETKQWFPIRKSE